MDVEKRVSFKKKGESISPSQVLRVSVGLLKSIQEAYLREYTLPKVSVYGIPLEPKKARQKANLEGIIKGLKRRNAGMLTVSHYKNETLSIRRLNQ